MKKIYTLMMMAMMATTAFAQEANDTTYVTMTFDENPWNYGVTEVTKGWSPDLTDWDAPGAITSDRDFSWPISEGSTQKVKITVYAVDLDESDRVSALGRCELNEAEAASAGIEAGKRIILYTVPGTTMRFEAPEGYKFGKMLFYNFRSPNFMVGDDYDEEHVYVYNDTEFKHKLKMWQPTSPKTNQYGIQTWEGDEKNIHFNYPSFSAHFTKIDMRLVPDGTTGISNVVANGQPATGNAYDLQGRQVSSQRLSKGIYVRDGKKLAVK